MNNTVKSIACLALAATAVTASAQSRSAYFLDNYAYNYQMNPALDRDGSFDISFPGLGNLNIGVNGNVGVKNFLYNREVDGRMRTVTFLHPDVSASEALGNLKTNNRIGANVREGIMSVGFRALGGYNHVSINAVANVQARLPKDLFSFVKEGVTNRNYEIGRVDAHADAYAEIALQHSHSLEKILPGLQVGAAFKFLIGIGNVDFNMDRADLNLGVDEWHATTSGQAHLSLGGMRWKTKLSDDGTKQLVDGIDTDEFSAPSGYGIAFDLGATYRLNQDWKFGLAFTDLGFISWSKTYSASTNGEHTFNTNDYVLDTEDFDNSWDKMRDDMEQLYQLEADTEASSRCRALEATMTVSAEYTLPVYRQVTFGLLNTTRMAHRFAWTEFRLSANYTPVKWLGLGVNYGLGTFGSSFGWILNIAPKGFNIYLGMDHTLGKLSKQYIPLNSNAQFSFGINVPI